MADGSSHQDCDSAALLGWPPRPSAHHRSIVIIQAACAAPDNEQTSTEARNSLTKADASRELVALLS